MSKSYDEIMEKIKVTDDMSTRILTNVQAAAAQMKSKIIPFPKVNPSQLVAVCLIILVGAIIIPKVIDFRAKPPGYSVTDPAGGIVECASAEELSKQVGFEVKDIKELPFNVTKSTYLSYWGTLAQIKYIGHTQTLTFRKSAEDGDNSGDYNIYNNKTEVKAANTQITLKGDEEQYFLAVWQKNGYSYSFSLKVGLSESQIISIVESIQ